MGARGVAVAFAGSLVPLALGAGLAKAAGTCDLSVYPRVCVIIVFTHDDDDDDDDDDDTRGKPLPPICCLFLHLAPPPPPPLTSLRHNHACVCIIVVPVAVRSRLTLHSRLLERTLTRVCVQQTSPYASAFDMPIKSALAIGASLAPTSMGISLKVLQDGGVLSTPTGQLIIAAAVMDDVIALVGCVRVRVRVCVCRGG